VIGITTTMTAEDLAPVEADLPDFSDWRRLRQIIYGTNLAK
jgi:hypothetical protein